MGQLGASVRSVPLWLWMALLLVVSLGISYAHSAANSRKDDTSNDGGPETVNDASEASLQNGYDNASTAYPVFVTNAEGDKGQPVPPNMTTRPEGRRGDS